MAKRVLVVGDIIIDRYIPVETHRKAAEGGLVWKKKGSLEDKRLGGAANVAYNIKSLGGDSVDVYLAGICDIATRRMLAAVGINESMCAHGESLEKIRFFTQENEFVFRYDGMDGYDEAALARFPLFFHKVRGSAFDAVVFSDYDKGTLTEDVVENAKLCSKLRIVDSKRRDLEIFAGANILKLNETEYGRQVSYRALEKKLPVEALVGYTVVTRGSKPTRLIMSENASRERYTLHTEEFPVTPKEEVDVTGCGDTHTAAMAYSMLFDSDMRAAVRLANEKASEVVQKFGTSVCSRAT